ncbi:MAG TPA: hypothetical protein VJS64_02990, partial [Pyrinomonadaceae bacterium]|nr:hypothetical protein [Pyrinomonadaceae bacterium]
MLRITALALALLLSTGVLLPFVDSEAHGLRQNFLAKRQYHHRRHSRAWWRRHRARMARLRMKRRMQAEIRAAHRRALLRPEFSLPMASAAPVLPMDYVPVPVLPMATSAPVPVLPMANYAPVPVLPAAASAPVPVLPMATSAPVSIGEPVAVPLPISVSVPAPVTITESAPVPAYRPVKITATAAVTTPVIDPVDVPSAVLATIPAPTLTTV